MPSSSLVPAGDPTLLFTSAGMVQFKPFFMGEATPLPVASPLPRRASAPPTSMKLATTNTSPSSRCWATSASVTTSRRKPSPWLGEMVTQQFGISPDRIYATIYLDDDEAYRHWRDDIGLPEERIYRYGGKDNWWGPPVSKAPCGPCSELQLRLLAPNMVVGHWLRRTYSPQPSATATPFPPAIPIATASVS